MSSHKETWGFPCVDKWEKWYGEYATKDEAATINRLRKRAQSLRNPEKQKEAYMEAIERLHNPLMRKLGIKNLQKAQVNFTHLGDWESLGDDEWEGLSGGELGYTIITWRKGD